jgi:hypothetical protein
LLEASFIMGWKQDRVLVFICAGQFLDDRPEKKFYFDKDDNIFFSLYLQNSDYKVFHRTPSNLTKELEENLRIKIEKVRTNSRSIIQIQKADKKFDYPPSIPAKVEEEFKLKWVIEKKMAQFAFRFLEENKIDLETADVIELY